MSIGLGIGAILIFVLLEGFFSGSEIALVNADRLRLQTQADEGNQGAMLALDLLENESRLLGTCLIGTNLSVVTGASIATAVLLQLDITGGLAVTLAFTPLVLIFGEALPKTILQHHADAAAPYLAYPLTFFAGVFNVFLAIVGLWTRALAVVFGAQEDAGITREEIIDLLDEEMTSPIDPDERRLIMGLLSLTECKVEDCMTPLVQVIAVNEYATIGVAADTAVRTNHSRLPVYRQRIDNVVGLVHQADLLFVDNDSALITDHIRPVRFVPEAKQADDLFQEMREHREHFVVVVDEYGGCVGIVTLEDLLEIFVGDIADERDAVEPRIIALDDGSYGIPGVAELDEIEEATRVRLPDGDYETIAGLVLEQLGRIPEAGDDVTVPGAILTVEEATDRAVRRVRLRVTATTE